MTKTKAADLPHGYWHTLREAALAASGGPWERSKQSDAVVSGDERRLAQVDEAHLLAYGGFVVAESMQPSDRRYVLLVDPAHGLAIAALMLRADDSPLTLEQARVVRSWAVDLECSNARVAELFDVTWGGGTDLGRGDELCAEARRVLGEAW